MRFTARRIIAIAALALTTFAATHAGDVSRQAGGIFEHATANHITIQAGGIFEHASATYATTPDGGIFE